MTTTQSSTTEPAESSAAGSLTGMRGWLQAIGCPGFRRGSAWRGAVSVSYFVLGVATLLVMGSVPAALVFAAGVLGFLVMAIDRARVGRLNAHLSAPEPIAPEPILSDPNAPEDISATRVAAAPARPKTRVAFWGSVAGLYFVGCAAWAAGPSLLQSSTAPQAGVSAVAAPTTEAAQEATPVPQATPTAQGQAAADATAVKAVAVAAQARRTALYGYIGTVTRGLSTYGKTLGTLSVLTNQAGNAPLVASSDDWKLKTATTATTLQTMAAQLAAISPVPPEMADVASLITQLNGETQLMSDDLTPGAGTLEAARLTSATAHAERIDRLSRRARDIMLGYTGGHETPS